MITRMQHYASSDGSGLTTSPASAGDTASPLAGLLGVMWHYKVFIASVTLAATVAASILSFTADDKYLASITLSPVSDDSNVGRLGGLAALASEIGGAATGISSPGNTQKQETLATLTSEALTERYIKDNNLLPILYDSKWDPVKHTWRDLPKDQIPTLWKANQFFQTARKGSDERHQDGLDNADDRLERP